MSAPPRASARVLAIAAFVSLVAIAAMVACDAADDATNARLHDEPAPTSTASTSASSSPPDAKAPPADGDATVVDGSPFDAPSASSAALVAARPYTFRVPAGYDPSKPTPLVVALHGYRDSGAFIDTYFQLGAIADASGFLYATPDGTIDLFGWRFWNATDACCNVTARPVDDVAYLNALLDDVESKYNVDPKRVFFVGHSNGAFMSHRFACDAAARVAAMVSFGGAQWIDGNRCVAGTPVSVLEIHGTADTTIRYDGGFAASFYPSAHQTVATWASKDGCTGALTATGATHDLVTNIAGVETTVEAYGGCGSAAVELWTVNGAPHVPPLAHPAWAEAMWGFLSAHARP